MGAAGTGGAQGQNKKPLPVNGNGFSSCGMDNQRSAPEGAPGKARTRIIAQLFGNVKGEFLPPQIPNSSRPISARSSTTEYLISS